MNSPRLLDRVLTRSGTRPVLIVAYVVVLLIILAPVLLTSVGADDSYWILERAHEYNGSYWDAFWTPVSHAFDFSGSQARTNALANGERGLLASFTLQVSTYFSIPPFVVWTVLKIVLFLSMIGAAVLFLRQVTFRDRLGDIQRLTPATIAFVATTLPLTIALGAKSQNVATLNGWNFYPTLTYGPFAGLLILAALTLRATGRLERSYRVWAVPMLIAACTLGFLLNLAYELMAVTVPLLVIVVLLRPRVRDTSWWVRWRPTITVLGGLVVSYSGWFLWIRHRISTMACQATDTCYAGTVIDVQPGTLRNNFLGSLPGGTSAVVGRESRISDRPYPDVNSISVVLAVLAVVLMLALWASWSARNAARTVDATASESTTAPTAPSRVDETRGLLVVIVVSLSIAIGCTIVSGISARAVELLQTSTISYRTNVVTWAALSLATVATVRLLLVSRLRWIGPVALAGLSVILVVGVALYFPRNVLSAQVNRNASVVFVDGLHREVTLGSRSPAADARRCAMLTLYLADRDEVERRIKRATLGAQSSFEFLHQRPFCSTGIPALFGSASSSS